jgi:hypothetical protein
LEGFVPATGREPLGFLPADAFAPVVFLLPPGPWGLPFLPGAPFLGATLEGVPVAPVERVTGTGRSALGGVASVDAEAFATLFDVVVPFIF